MERPLPKSIDGYINFIKMVIEHIKTLQQFVSYLLLKLDGIERMLRKGEVVDQLRSYLKPRKSKNKFKAKSSVRPVRVKINGPAEDLKQIGLSIHAVVEMKERFELLIRRLLRLIGSWSSPGIVTDLLNDSRGKK